MWSGPAQSSPIEVPSRLAPDLAAALEQAAPTQKIAVIAYMRAPHDPSAPAAGENLETRRRQQADSVQGSLLAALREAAAAGQVEAITPLWIVNAVAFRAEPAVVQRTAARPDVERVAANTVYTLPPEPAPALQPAAATAALTVTDNISATHAPLLWSIGFTGAGVVVASLDTGVDATHPDLAPRQRPGAGNWYDPYNQCGAPCDYSPINHGTHVLGLLIGGNAGGPSVGMAPGAQWIAARVFNNSGLADLTSIHLVFQWVLDPDGNPATPDAPQIVNASWDFLNAGGCNLEFAADLQTLVQAGIVPVYAAGNAGPNPSTAESPANNPDALPVGNVDNAGLVHTTSSRGPTSCGTGVARTYPDLAAPGTNVLTTDRMVTGDPTPRFAYATGTSFSAPEVSGALALLLSAFPGRTFSVAELRVALTRTARPLGIAPNNDTGAGMLDVWAAYQAILGGALPTATPTWTPPPATATLTRTPTRTATSTSTSTSTVTPTAAGPQPVRLFLPLINQCARSGAFGCGGAWQLYLPSLQRAPDP